MDNNRGIQNNVSDSVIIVDLVYEKSLQLPDYNIKNYYGNTHLCGRIQYYFIVYSTGIRPYDVSIKRYNIRRAVS